MASLLEYTEADADRDAALYMMECFDINTYSFVNHGDIHGSPGSVTASDNNTTTATTGERQDVLDMVAKHLKNVRFLEFAETALSMEIERVKQFNTNTTSSSSSSNDKGSPVNSEGRDDHETETDEDKHKATVEAAEPEGKEDDVHQHDDEDNWELVDRYSNGRLSTTSAERSGVIKLPLSIPLRDIVNSMTSPTTCQSTEPTPTTTPTDGSSPKPQRVAVRLETNQSRELQLKQLKKDIERDRLLLNSQRLIGANIGIDKIIQSIIQVLHTLADECLVTRLNDNIAKEIALAILLKASRTHSGALAFQALQNLLNPEKFMLLPQSSSTPPLNICIRLGSQVIPPSLTTIVGTPLVSPTVKPIDGGVGGGGMDLGYVCRISCESRYKVQKRIDSMMMMMDDDNMNEEGREEDMNNKKDVVEDVAGQEGDQVSDLMVDKVVSALFEDFIFCPLPQPLYGKWSSDAKNDDSESNEIIMKQPSMPDANTLLQDCNYGQVLISLFE